MKTCFKCEEEKDESEFYAHKKMSDGLLGKCKNCTKKDVSDNRDQKREYYIEYNRKRAMLPHRVEARQRYAKTAEGKAAAKKARLSWKIANPKKLDCFNKVNYAVSTGKIVKKTECESCGGNRRLHGHHCDYDKPLDVIWLCSGCHMAWHKKNGPGLNG